MSRRRYNVLDQQQPKKRSKVAIGLACIAVFFFIMGCYYLTKAYLNG